MSTDERTPGNREQAEGQEAGRLTLNKDTLQDLDTPIVGGEDVRGGALAFQPTTVCMPKFETGACISVGVACRPSQGPTCGG